MRFLDLPFEVLKRIVLLSGNPEVFCVNKFLAVLFLGTDRKIKIEFILNQANGNFVSGFQKLIKKRFLDVDLLEMFLHQAIPSLLDTTFDKLNCSNRTKAIKLNLESFCSQELKNISLLAYLPQIMFSDGHALEKKLCWPERLKNNFSKVNLPLWIFKPKKSNSLLKYTKLIESIEESRFKDGPSPYSEYTYCSQLARAHFSSNERPLFVHDNLKGKEQSGLELCCNTRTDNLCTNHTLNSQTFSNQKLHLGALQKSAALSKIDYAPIVESCNDSLNRLDLAPSRKERAHCNICLQPATTQLLDQNKEKNRLLELVDYLLALGVSPKSHKGLPLINSVISKNSKMVKLLLHYGADPNCNENMPALIASANGDIEILNLLFEHGAVANPKCQKLAVKNKHWNVVELLMLHNIMPDLKN
ncbi:hypothetical protein BB560_000884 [Smittium megazygosporum]|uniref:Ankyrin repeat protein n=1 Tax=Smittium megazygosporum TaxID=133381 RepID=A0A2T9ZJ56_9FUNG|nr:hypothetical protein BB560_000884 [Smittium megazygosporum]